MNIWAVANQKGGVGKTTTAVTLAGLLCRRGGSTLLIDLDPHGSMTSYFGFDPDGIEESVYTLFELAGKGIAEPPEEILTKTDYEHLVLLPASTALATLDRQMAARQGMGLVLARALRRFTPRFDHVIIDCPPVLGILMVNALAVCDRLIIPVQTEFLALKGLERMQRTLAMVLRARKQGLPSIIVPTMFDRNSWPCLESLQELRGRYPAQVWDAEIPVDSQFRDASRAGIPLPLVNLQAPGVVAYRALLDGVLCPQGREMHKLVASS